MLAPIAHIPKKFIQQSNAVTCCEVLQISTTFAKYPPTDTPELSEVSGMVALSRELPQNIATACTCGRLQLLEICVTAAVGSKEAVVVSETVDPLREVLVVVVFAVDVEIA